MTLYDKIDSGERITAGEAAQLLNGGDLLQLGLRADARRRALHPGNTATFQIDRNINYTNICECRCRFCAFYRDEGAPDAYLLSVEDVLAKTDEAVHMGATQVKVRVGGRKAVQVRPADGGEQQRIRLRGRDAVEEGWDVHFDCRAMLVTASNASATEMVNTPPFPESNASLHKR